MASYTWLRNAPILEALVDIRVKQNPKIKLDDLDSAYDLIAKSYPDKKIGKEVKVVLGTDKLPTEKETYPIGFKYSSNDGRQVVQFRLDGFTFSRLKPYQDWERLRDEARRLWDIYHTISKPELITKLALRYINKINLPLTENDLDEYFTVSPKAPQSLPQYVSSFLSRIVLHEPSNEFIAIISQVLEGAEADSFPIFLDIDVFKEARDGFNINQIWPILERLRDFKNKIFFESITEKTKEMLL